MTSGFVSLPRMPLIMRLRVCRSTMSTIGQLYSERPLARDIRLGDRQNMRDHDLGHLAHYGHDYTVSELPVSLRIADWDAEVVWEPH